jgi:hypothetical protein
MKRSIQQNESRKRRLHRDSEESDDTKGPPDRSKNFNQGTAYNTMYNSFL